MVNPDLVVTEMVYSPRLPKMKPGHLYIGIPLVDLSHEWYKLVTRFKQNEISSDGVQIDIDLDNLSITEEE